MVVCHRMCDYHHEHLEEEERLTIMVTTIGEKAQGEGCHYDTTTRMTSMITATQDQLQERSEKRTTTSSDYIIRLTDRLLRCGTKIITCFSQPQLFLQVGFLVVPQLLLQVGLGFLFLEVAFLC